ncbi:MAG: pilus assembly protein PilP [Deltaproteobacteria bacterium]|nr:pilus assembly protein PilP [Deltaproteobacteria bacterium]MBW2621221.1 pilus assembly protein PilP [Deltaproteobacteria bacterium]
MDQIIVIMRSFICFVCFFSLVIGCDKKAEPPQKAREVTRKIIVAKKDDLSKSVSKQETVKPTPKAVPGISKSKAGVSNDKLVALVSTTTQKIETSKITDLYNPEGKLDPFAPLIKEKPVNLPVKHGKAVRRKLLTPLEKLDLSQLKLVAILRAQSGNKAMVEEDSGKGYVIKKGMYIGIHSGKVAKILSDRIIIEEEVEDIYGKISVQKKEIKLKPPGEE